MKAFENLSWHFKPISQIVVLFLVLVSAPAAAELIEAAPGVRVTKRTYAAPTNEQPFFGFASKDSAQQAADDSFVAALTKAVGTREKAFEEVMKRGWRALGAGKLGEVTQRFNQAFLVLPHRSEVYHGFAAISQLRFNDPDAADELFRIARSQPDPSKALNADYGRFLLIAKRPRDALPVLEQAVKDAPDFGDAWTNLGWARMQNGDSAAACTAAAEAGKQRPSNNSAKDLVELKNVAQCK